jgi:hypothetical protein
MCHVANFHPNDCMRLQVGLKEKEIGRLIGEYQRLQNAKEAEIQQLAKKVRVIRYCDSPIWSIKLVTVRK